MRMEIRDERTDGMADLFVMRAIWWEYMFVCLLGVFGLFYSFLSPWYSSLIFLLVFLLICLQLFCSHSSSCVSHRTRSLIE
jgi:uncharacterized membrane protein